MVATVVTVVSHYALAKKVFILQTGRPQLAHARFTRIDMRNSQTSTALQSTCDQDLHV